MKVNCRSFNLLAAMGGLFFTAVAAVSGQDAKPESPERPNILLIVADDLGYGELSCQGNAQLATPNIDSLAKNGVRFTSGYVSGPVCGPTRAGLMTGLYQQRFGFEFNLMSSGGGLPAGAKTIAERLKSAGYVTGMFGKWHLGSNKLQHPTQRGFDWFYGFMPACRPFPLKPGELGKSLLDDAAPKHDYMTDALGAEAAAFIERHRDEPWFVYLPFGAVHAPPARPGDLPPQSSPARYRNRFADVADAKRRTFLGMELAMDDAVGVVLSKLRELDLEENTLIFFVSDNGGPTWQTTSRNDPLRGSKGDVLEGGIRVPFIIQWKGRLLAGQVDDRPIIQLDILPTALAAAGRPLPTSERIDGVNLLPYLTDEKQQIPHDLLFWRYGTKHAVRQGDWKLTDQGAGAKLYNLAQDIGEKDDLSAKHPDKVAELEAAYQKWNANNTPAKWGREGRPGKVKTEIGTRQAP